MSMTPDPSAGAPQGQSSPPPPGNSSSTSDPVNPLLAAIGSLSGDQLVQLLMGAMDSQRQAIQGLQAQVRTAAPTPEPTMPAFVSTQIPPSKSLPDMFPLVEAGTLLDIARHEFRPMDLRKLDSKLRDKADDEGSASLATFTSRPSTSKDYPSLSAVIPPLTLYFRILTQFAAAHGGQISAVAALSFGTLAYIEHLHALNLRYDWMAVLQYHMAFHGLRRREMINGDYTGWARSESELMTQFLWGHERKRSASGSASSMGSATKSGKSLISEQVCYAWNSGSCTVSSCKRKHECSKCHSKDHTDKECPKKDK
jgi:hypothetical protein